MVKGLGFRVEGSGSHVAWCLPWWSVMISAFTTCTFASQFNVKVSFISSNMHLQVRFVVDRCRVNLAHTGQSQPDCMVGNELIAWIVRAGGS